MPVSQGENHQSDRLGKIPSSSVWLEFSPLAQITESLNLGQGFPDWSPPPFVKDAVVKSMDETNAHQYARSAGMPALVKSIQSCYSDKLMASIDWQQNILVTVGASEAIVLCFLSFINPGDEVILATAKGMAIPARPRGYPVPSHFSW